MNLSATNLLHIVISEGLNGRGCPNHFVVEFLILAEDVIVILTPTIDSALLSDGHAKRGGHLNVHDLDKIEVDLDIFEDFRIFHIVSEGQDTEPVFSGSYNLPASSFRFVKDIQHGYCLVSRTDRHKGFLDKNVLP